MKQKKSVRRRPGAGRKPQGEFSGNSDALHVRVPREVRVGLERAAKKNGRSFSQEVQKRIRRSLANDHVQRPDHIEKMAAAIMWIAADIERETGKRWLDDACTTSKLKKNIETFISHFGAKGDVAETNIDCDEAFGLITGIEMWRHRNFDETVNYIDPSFDNAPSDWNPLWEMRKALIPEEPPRARPLPTRAQIAELKPQVGEARAGLAEAKRRAGSKFGHLPDQD